MGQPEERARISDLARVLAVAWRNIAAYPPGHPTFVASLTDAHRKVVDLAELSGTMTFGVSREALLVGEDKLTGTHTQKLAEALYKRHVGILTVKREVQAWELEALFRSIAKDTRQQDAPIWTELTSAGVTNIEALPVDYSGIHATEEVEEGEDEPKESSLFEDILKAILTGRELSELGADLDEKEAMTAEGIASLLMKYLDNAAGLGSGTSLAPAAGAAEARVKAGREIGESIAGKVEKHLTRRQGDRREVTIHQIAELLRSLPKEIRERVLISAIRILASDPDAEGDLRALAAALSPDEVLRALSSVRHDGAPLSSHALRLLQKLMTTGQANESDFVFDEEAMQLAAQISTLLGEEDVDRYNPPEHKAVLEAMDVEITPSTPGARERAMELGNQRLNTLGEDFLTSRVRTALLEMIPRRPPAADMGPAFARLEAQFLELLGTMQMAEAIELMDAIQTMERDESYPEHVRAAAHKSIEALASGDAIHVLVDWLHLASDDLVPQIQRIIDLFGSAATRKFLYALAEENDRSRRRRLFDFLAALGPVIVPDAIALLSDQRWYVVRNMIALLRTVGDRRSLPEVRKLTMHPDMRVRLEAIKSLLTSEGSLPRDLLEKAIHDPDPKLAENAVVLCGTYGIGEAEEALVRVVLQRDWLGHRRSIRMKALRALAELGKPTTPALLAPLLRERFFSFAPSVERILAWELLEAYPPEARDPWLEEGRNSRHARIRDIARRLSPRRGTIEQQMPV